MKVVQFAQFGEPCDVVRVVDEPAPVAGAGEVVVRLTARAIHPSDLMRIRGRYGRPPPLPAVPGNDAAGVVAAVGHGVSSLHVGDRVTLLLGATRGEGTWREQVRVPADLVLPTPAPLSDEQAGALWVNYLSVWVMGVELLALGPSDVLLQTAAGSQLGRAMMELARLRGFSLINVVRRREQVDELKRLGQQHVFATAEGSLAERVRGVVGKPGLRFAIDAVGGSTGEAVIDALGPGGTMLVFGALDGTPIPVNSGTLLFRELTVKGFWLTRWLQSAKPEVVRAAVGAVMHHAARGDFKPAIDQTYPLSAVRDAVIRAETPGRSGSVVLVPDHHELAPA